MTVYRRLRVEGEQKTASGRAVWHTTPTTRIICTMCSTVFQAVVPRSKKTVSGLDEKSLRQDRCTNEFLLDPMMNCGNSACRGGQSVMNAAYVRFVRCCVLVARNLPPTQRGLCGNCITAPRVAFGTKAMEVSSMLSLMSRLPVSAAWEA